MGYTLPRTTRAMSSDFGDHMGHATVASMRAHWSFACAAPPVPWISIRRGSSGLIPYGCRVPLERVPQGRRGRIGFCRSESAYRSVPVTVKETTTSGWVWLPDHVNPPGHVMRERLPAEVGKARVTRLAPRYIHGVALPKNWADRGAEIQRIAGLLERDDVHLVNIVAIGGTGKTSVMRKVADYLTERSEKQRPYQCRGAVCQRCRGRGAEFWSGVQTQKPEHPGRLGR